MAEDDAKTEETLVEMVYRWRDVERAMPRWTRKNRDDPENPIQIGQQLRGAVDWAFRVEAFGENRPDDFGETYEQSRYRLLFDVEVGEARDAAKFVRKRPPCLGR